MSEPSFQALVAAAAAPGLEDPLAHAGAAWPSPAPAAPAAPIVSTGLRYGGGAAAGATALLVAPDEAPPRSAGGPPGGGRRKAPSRPPIDPALIEACQRGHRPAFQALFELCYPRVYSLAYYHTGNDAAARDVTQQVFLTVFTQIRRFRKEALFDTWLYRIVVNACLRERKTTKRWLRQQEAFDPDLAVSGSHEREYLRRQVRYEVRRAVATLKPTLRLAIILKHVEGLSYDEMAAVLRCSKGTVASRLNRARAALAERLGHLRHVLEEE